MQPGDWTQQVITFTERDAPRKEALQQIEVPLCDGCSPGGNARNASNARHGRSAADAPAASGASFGPGTIAANQCRGRW